MRKPELLAPVGSWDALVAAVQNGADAVYIGGKLFNARQYANNFDEEEMTKAIDYCHVRGVKVYVTVNTLVADQELPVLAEYLKFLYEAGVDAIIVQDLGVARIAARLLPELDLHASTQMTLHNSPGVAEVKQMGFKRVVLARETSLEEIKRIKEEGVEIEFFVHGALCISYSGQCLMSSMIGGRSGNRGRCAQPCRLNYTLVDEKGKVVLEPEKVGKYLLSPRDLRLLYHIPELAEAGVNALKIEGRMKRPEYVATVTRVYRGAVDRYAAAPFDYHVTPEEEKQLMQIFNRDFSVGYIEGALGQELMSYKRPNNRGIKIGRVLSYDHRRGILRLELEEPLAIGDGIEIWVTEGGRRGANVHEIFADGEAVEKAEAGQVVELPLKGKVRTGDRIFKTYDAELMRKAQNSFNSPKEIRKITISMTVKASLGKPLEIQVEDSQGNKAVAKTGFVAEEAINRPLTKETVRRQVERLGNTPFHLGKLDINISGDLMVPLSEINDTRRKAMNLLEQQRIMLQRPAPLPRPIFEDRQRSIEEDTLQTTAQRTGKILLSVAVGTVEAAGTAVAAGADVVYLGADGLRGAPVLQPAALDELAAIGARKNTEVVLSTPRITKDKDIKYLAPLLEKALQLDMGVLVTNLGMLKLARELKFSKIYADYPLNVFNIQTALWLKEHGVGRITLSPELTLGQLGKLAGPLPAEVITQGALPLMISEHCVIGSTTGGLKGDDKCNEACHGKGYALKDRLGLMFPIVTDRFCRTHVYNPKELCLVEDLAPLYQAGIKLIRMEVKKDPADYVARVTKIYRQELDKLLSNIDSYTPTPDIKEKVTGLTEQGITKGHLYRGVL